MQVTQGIWTLGPIHIDIFDLVGKGASKSSRLGYPITKPLSSSTVLDMI